MAVAARRRSTRVRGLAQWKLPGESLIVLAPVAPSAMSATSAVTRWIATCSRQSNPKTISDPQDAAVTKLSAVHAIDKLVHRIAWPAAGTVSHDEIVSREWLVTNGLGGYASGTVAGAITRRYHAPLIAALPAPHGRVVMLNHLVGARPPARPLGASGSACTRTDGKFAQTEGTQHLVEFRLEAGLPVWRYRDRKYHDREAPADARTARTPCTSATRCSTATRGCGSGCVR